MLPIALNGSRHPVGPGLERLGGDYDHEAWCGSVDDVRAFVLGLPDRPDADAAEPAERLYRELIDRLRDSPFPYPLRLWNYLPAINLGDGDDERYRRFCVGRGRALEAAGLADAQMCAATAIGGEAPVMQLVALVGRRPGVSIENPRQVSAWNYPRDYGPRQPAFARATAVPLSDGRTGLLISGTASVIGHATAHPGDVVAQTDEAASNLDALLRNAAGTLERPSLAYFSTDALARVYVRHAEDWPRIRARLRSRWPALRLCALRGDVCRDDLLVEIEAWQVA
ncbi:pteridine-dependent deoxygenase [Wenzhouxiangella sp. XN79A]|uniref:chorismate transformation enzyme, FkbO/Hyg5 family n=1 Tax=Wenzhouxiangella sp. XN79A TaxID=2724193 RepID=UPI00144AB803|nr:pteridine-dependent deoxygenase [Wenzhouxiangella sp. XN79A]NKI33864.1 pteridine-dependent deoxygenase [Wenzhouxiangella sp. XN79A]